MIYNTAMTDTNPIRINYSDARLRVLVEEYIIQQRSAFTLQGVCSYVLYWAMEDGHTTNTGLFESSQLAPTDCQRVCALLDKIIREGRIAAYGEQFKKLTN